MIKKMDSNENDDIEKSNKNSEYKESFFDSSFAEGEDSLDQGKLSLDH